MRLENLRRTRPLPDSTGPNAEVHETPASPPPSTFSHDPDKKRVCAFFH
ncbi:hypothetical protein CGMCC3_g5549 [Colletotrichum fructicola]|nr:uncharacterized protein CGMCC3_g5549 [Colletotrichum fructicola]KAE9578563.1 hypothetical protein CGMCC3_g5549 [Colletotrichum fructicola]